LYEKIELIDEKLNFHYKTKIEKNYKHLLQNLLNINYKSDELMNFITYCEFDL